MALSTAELYRVKYELGFNTLKVGAEPYISFVSLFDNIIAPFLEGGASTRSGTPVTAAATPTVVLLELEDGTGFNIGDRVVIDVDDQQETVTVRDIPGLGDIYVALTKAHSADNGMYPVTVEGGETIVRELLKNIRDVKKELASTFGTGALKAVDEVEFYDARGRTLFGNLGQQLMFWRDELASCLGIQSAWASKRAAAQRVAVY